MSQPILVFHHKGDFSKTNTFLKRVLHRDIMSVLDKYGRIGVQRLSAATPVDTGKTASSWFYEIRQDNDNYRILWNNSNRNEGYPIALLIQYGHGTRGGTFVEGRDFINPALRPVFDNIAQELWKEVTG